MRKQSVFVVALLLVLMLLVSLTAFAAPQRYRVQSKIGGTQYGATQEIGHFRVGANGSASAFQGGANVISSAANQAIGYGFHIERIGVGNQKTVTVFERSWNGQVDTPVALSNLVLGPGYYALLVGGRPGSTAEITFNGINVTLD
jgi:hypothetical protein